MPKNSFLWVALELRWGGGHHQWGAWGDRVPLGGGTGGGYQVWSALLTCMQPTPPPRGGSIDTTKTRSGPQRGKQSDTEALYQPPLPPHISVDTTKTRSGPQRVGMCGGERPIGAAKGKQSDTEALYQPPPPPPPRTGPRPEGQVRHTRMVAWKSLPALEPHKRAARCRSGFALHSIYLPPHSPTPSSPLHYYKDPIFDSCGAYSGPPRRPSPSWATIWVPPGSDRRLVSPPLTWPCGLMGSLQAGPCVGALAHSPTATGPTPHPHRQSTHLVLVQGSI